MIKYMYIAFYPKNSLIFTLTFSQLVDVDLCVFRFRKMHLKYKSGISASIPKIPFTFGTPPLAAWTGRYRPPVPPQLGSYQMWSCAKVSVSFHFR